MITKSDILEVIHQQVSNIDISNTYIRGLLSEFSELDKSFVHIITGIRRCGKSTLLEQIISNIKEDALYINFDTPQLFGFELTHFRALDDILKDNGKVKWLFFDEIQVVPSWEIYVRGKLDQGYGVVLTGSNVSLLSRELGTKLTGRHLSKELFPFSYHEFCQYKKIEKNLKSLVEYLDTGGFPQYIKTQNKDILHQLVTDIIYRDIAVRYNIRDEQTLKRMFVYLVSNVANLISGTKAKQLLSIKSTSTILDYLSHYEQTYLLHLLPKFSYSRKAQLVNPRKIYLIDTGLQFVSSTSFSGDLGRRLENMVFLELRRLTTELFYFNENGRECDFVVCQNGSIIALIQVCYELNADNIYREKEGLWEAMRYFDLPKGYILTANREDVLYIEEKMIEIKAVHSFNFAEIVK